ncbi:hypothetical protein Moror_11716 [Moniliophthora roreri MCA 2997]|uniref:F-box domain-containing protein n=1 Tax=Moniliophthora roreri (strain MCA 2997) TaxID=1381753 RepID=V2WKI4_MONRO|nr:hypothetical protein Moror_11716 [Moniliophthora roreri MCA 2997]
MRTHLGERRCLPRHHVRPLYWRSGACRTRVLSFSKHHQQSTENSLDNFIQIQTSVMRTSEASRVVELPDLLRPIFMYCSRGSNAKNASVCKLWSDISLDFVWEEISDLDVIFGRLGTVQVSKYYERSFSPPPKYQDWHRFYQQYARRVRRLNLQGLDETKQSRMTSLFNTLARLDINNLGYTHYSVLFMHPAVQKFEIHVVNTVNAEILGEYFQAVGERMPNLTFLCVEAPQVHHDALQSTLFLLIKALPCLELLKIPSFPNTSLIVAELARSAQLKGLFFTRSSKEVGTQEFRPFSPEISFHSLLALTLHMPYATFTHFIRPNYPSFTPIRYLHIFSTSPTSEAPATVKDLLESCANLPGLHHLWVEFDSRFSPSAPETRSAVDLIHFQHISPILQNTRITEFRLTHLFPLILTQNDIENIAFSWKNLVSIDLNHDPKTDPPSDCTESITLNATVPFSRHCPLLRVLCLRMLPCVKVVDMDPTIGVMRYMDTFSPGYIQSDIDDVQVSLFLSRVLPWGCRIEFPSGEWEARWRDVKKGLVLIEAMRESLKRELKRELQLAEESKKKIA